MVHGKERINQLDLQAKVAAGEALAELESLPFDVMITETQRSNLRQLAYFAQGRLPQEDVNALRRLDGLAPTTDKGIITQLDGIKYRSKHQDGQAMDVVPMKDGKLNWNASTDTWLSLGAIAKRHGFKWGGDWKNHPAAVLGWDCPHWEV